jgi:hypothetical protein
MPPFELEQLAPEHGFETVNLAVNSLTRCVPVVPLPSLQIPS